MNRHLRIHKLRHWKHADAGWFRDMDLLCFPSPNDAFLNSSNYHWWLLQYDGTDVGYAGLYIDPKTNTAHFCRAGILPDWRGAGWQKHLINARLKWCRKHGIARVRTYAAPENRASITNLKACGFRSRANRKDGYVTLWRDL